MGPQKYDIKQKILSQDNQSAIKIKKREEVVHWEL